MNEWWRAVSADVANPAPRITSGHPYAPGLDGYTDTDPIARMEDELIDLRARVARLEQLVADMPGQRGRQ